MVRVIYAQAGILIRGVIVKAQRTINQHRRLVSSEQKTKRLSYSSVLLLVASVLMLTEVNAGSREQAKRMHDRLAGVPPTESVLLDMAADIEAGNGTDAALTAMNNDAFYNVTLKNWAMPWTNREQDVFQPLNDYVATVIGLVRDGTDFRELLYGDVVYVGDANLSIPSYSNSNNDHYQALEEQGHSLRDNLVQLTQSSVTGLPAEATAGVMTSRAAAKAFFIAGTNRANFRFTMLNHLCLDMEQVHDVTRPPDRIRQDVTRSPGGDSRVFLNGCMGCHNGMDPLAQAYAYYDYVYDADNDPDAERGSIDYNDIGDIDSETGTRVKAKYHINEANFPQGYVTPDDSWNNYWRDGPNALLNWDASLSGSGSGAKSMGQELSHSGAFASCQVKKVFSLVCLREPQNSADRDQLDTMEASFAANGYDLKQVFAESADYCKGE